MSLRKTIGRDRVPSPDPADPTIWLVPLADGSFAIIDEEDVCRLDEYLWMRKSDPGKPEYAFAVEGRGTGRKVILMHRFLFGLTPEDRIEVDHKNGNGLDNRRSTNLRLASHRQNTTNRKRRSDSRSCYKGVHRTKHGTFTTQIVRHLNGRQVHVSLGTYASEHEAAFAYNIAAPLLMDPAFTRLNPIPDPVMPDARRQAEIKKLCVERIKLRLAGRKVGARPRPNVAKSTPYRGARFDWRKGSWRASIYGGQGRLNLGSFHTDIEAAIAYNFALPLADIRYSRGPNVIPAADLPPPAVVESIRLKVAANLART